MNERERLVEDAGTSICIGSTWYWV